MLKVAAGGNFLPSMDIPHHHLHHHKTHQTGDLPPMYRRSSMTASFAPTADQYASPEAWRIASRSSIPMSIPGSRSPPPPPALPPPRFLEQYNSSESTHIDRGYEWIQHREQADAWMDGNESKNSRPSIYGSLAVEGHRGTEPPMVQQRKSISPTINIPRETVAHSPFHAVIGKKETCARFDEGYGSLSGTSIVSYDGRPRFDDSPNSRSSFSSSIHDQFRTTNRAYDQSLLSKLDSRSKIEPRASLSLSLNNVKQGRERESKSLSKPLSLPITQLYSSSPISRFAEEAPVTSSPKALLPCVTQASRAFTSPFAYEDRAYLRTASLDQNMDIDMEETSGLRRLQIAERSTRPEEQSPVSAVGQKRKASFPMLDEEIPAASNASTGTDPSRRRDVSSRASPVPRLHSSRASVSSIASASRNNSLTSTSSIGFSSNTTISSSGPTSEIFSPSGRSTRGLTPGAVSSGGVSPRSTEPIPDPSFPNPMLKSGLLHQGVSESRPIPPLRKAKDLAPRVGPAHQTGYLCECCPKKPKKFETEEELNLHGQEKQYECAYCKNRFKNKNEAERHQNSLHLRRHSWSCAALAGYPAAFHVSQIRPNEADTCGYCGEEFFRTGSTVDSHGMGSTVKYASDRDWEVRIHHLTDVHKFGECNHAKKFFRADHFRQHLKHSHAGTSGRWTNMLENACMKDEPMPTRIREEEESS